MLGAVGRLMSAVSCGTTFTPLALFAAGEQGVWYDPSDMTTLFQDSAGTTPVTAVEQPVGKILDKSGRGNHATQSTSASRPVLSARYNLLTKTEQFDDAAWTKSRVSISGNSITAPDGTTTADKVTEDTSTNTHRLYSTASIPIPLNTSVIVSIYAKAAGRTQFSIRVPDGNTNGANVVFDLATVTTSVTGGLTVTSRSITAVGNDWFFCTFTAPVQTSANSIMYIALRSSGLESYTGDGTSGIYIWGADIRVSNDGVGIPAYQRVNTSTDYDTAGFPMYLKFDGTDDSLATSSIDFSGTDKMTVWAGVRKLSDAASGAVTELGNLASDNGVFALHAPNNAVGLQYRFSLRNNAGTVTDIGPSSGYAAPITNVLTGAASISGNLMTFRSNGSQIAQSTANQGSGNFGNYALNVGNRAGGSLRFNGRLYSLIVRGAASSTTQISSTEAWVNGKTMAY